MKEQDFVDLLDKVVDQLTMESREKGIFTSSKSFENRVREVLVENSCPSSIDFNPHPYIFPDIIIGEYGIEVKFTTNDTWRSVANSVFESTRANDVKDVYLVFGKMGGNPEVKWGKYEDCVMHVRTSHVPRFEVEIGTSRSLFKQMDTSYNEFRTLELNEKMHYIRKYARSRLRKGERLWWLEDRPEKDHSLSIQVRLYMNLAQEEKRRLRAEAAILCPQIVKPSRAKNKYDDAVLYILTYHGVLCPQARDLFSAGSVALRGDPTRGGIYILRSLKDIESEMEKASIELDEALFEEYWGEKVDHDKRTKKWLELADTYAKDWVPSDHLFLKNE